MTLRFCRPNVALVAADYWQPTEAFDFSWSGSIGCNQMQCRTCGQKVLGQVVRNETWVRRYECRCQTYDMSYETRTLHGEPDWAIGTNLELATEWYCMGHPQVTLPMTIDGVHIEAGNLAQVVAQTLVNQPFIAPGVSKRTNSFWVQRLYHLMPDKEQRDAISQAVATELHSEDPVVIRTALEFFDAHPRAAGAMEVAELACSDKDRLLAITDPKYPENTMYSKLL